ncbi:hypothetical protein CBX96_20345 [Shewanella sp. BC20]|uniref:hypothetical protein n=1 Tax=Shewanella sp. BC20 TaxID=2004459 RepID=UPI000D642B44|nr:hypothetical protein [Shewanella sp. BC20]PWF61584.1 hypothetical protein CBX96_20345 [Shewanella sp. BC20]
MAKSMKNYWMLMLVFVSLSLTACSNIDFQFEGQSDEQVDPNQPTSDPMVQDNERRVRDAREDGRLEPSRFKF